MTTRERTVGRYLRWVLAALALGAGIIHFAVSADHYEVTWMHGTFFAVVAWLQVSWAVGVVLKPTRTLLIAGVVLNAAVIGGWVMSRVWGTPFGDAPWNPEPIGWADGLSVIFEALIIAVSLAVLVRPAIARAQLRPSFGAPLVAVPALAVAVVSSLALSPALASDHSHGGEEAAGHAHSGLVSAADGHAGGHGGMISNAAVGDTQCEKSGPPASEGQVTDAEGNHGHRGPVEWAAITDPAERDLLQQQLEIADSVTLQYPTVADAEAGGWRLVTTYVPCIGSHYIKTSYMGGFDPAKPGMLLYDGTAPDSKIVGLSYAMIGKPGEPPDGFAGPNDPWHQHNLNGGLCMKNGVVVGAESTTKAECTARGGSKIALDGLWMNHTWVVDGWPSSWGLFSAEHPDLGGVTGNSHASPDEVRQYVKKLTEELRQKKNN